MTANSPPKVEIADNFYTSLDSDQRFRLAVDALARRDNAESERLNATAHYETVRTRSPAYFIRLQVFHDLMLAHGIFTRDAVIDAQWALLESCASAAGDRSSDRNEALLRAVISQLLTSR